MKDLLNIVARGGSLDESQTGQAFGEVMAGRAEPAQLGALLGMLALRGPTVDEIVGAAKAMRAHATLVQGPAGLRLIDTCGTGGDHAQTFNISTGAAIVAAAAARPRGVAVAKHGNKAATSQSGSSQVLEALGVKLQATPATLARCLDEAGLCFCFAPAHHPAMKHVAPIRAALGFRTIFNVLGPLTNPAGARRQVVGVYEQALTPTIAAVLGRLGAERAWVVHGRIGEGGLDEISTAGPTQVSEWRDGAVRTFALTPATLGLPWANAAALRADSVDASAAILRDVLAGQRGSPRDIVLANAAAALVVAEVADDLPQGLALAADALDTGAAAATLAKLVALTQACST